MTCDEGRKGRRVGCGKFEKSSQQPQLFPQPSHQRTCNGVTAPPSATPLLNWPEEQEGESGQKPEEQYIKWNGTRADGKRPRHSLGTESEPVSAPNRFFCWFSVTI